MTWLLVSNTESTRPYYHHPYVFQEQICMIFERYAARCLFPTLYSFPCFIGFFAEITGIDHSLCPLSFANWRLTFSGNCKSDSREISFLAGWGLRNGEGPLGCLCLLLLSNSPAWGNTLNSCFIYILIFSTTQVRRNKVDVIHFVSIWIFLRNKHEARNLDTPRQI